MVIHIETLLLFRIVLVVFLFVSHEAENYSFKVCKKFCWVLATRHGGIKMEQKSRV